MTTKQVFRSILEIGGTVGLIWSCVTFISPSLEDTARETLKDSLKRTVKMARSIRNRERLYFCPAFERGSVAFAGQDELKAVLPDSAGSALTSTTFSVSGQDYATVTEWTSVKIG